MKQLIFLLLLFQSGTPRHFQAYLKACNGKNVMVDPDHARYEPCDETIDFKGNRISLCGEVYTTYSTEKLGDSNRAYFGYRMKGKDSVFLSFVVVPGADKDKWKVLATWQDSTKAFQTIAIWKQ